MIKLFQNTRGVGIIWQRRRKSRRRGVLLLLLLFLSLVCSTLIEFGWIGDRWPDSSAVRGIKIWNQLLLCRQTLTSAATGKSIKEIKSWSRDKKVIFNEPLAFNLSWSSGAEAQLPLLSALLRRAAASRRCSREVWPLNFGGTHVHTHSRGGIRRIISYYGSEI